MCDEIPIFIYLYSTATRVETLKRFRREEPTNKKKKNYWEEETACLETTDLSRTLSFFFLSFLSDEFRVSEFGAFLFFISLSLSISRFFIFLLSAGLTAQLSDDEAKKEGSQHSLLP